VSDEKRIWLSVGLAGKHADPRTKKRGPPGFAILANGVQRFRGSTAFILVNGSGRGVKADTPGRRHADTFSFRCEGIRDGLPSL
jgi:hypothetical protein